VIFSPRGSLEALDAYETAMDDAQRGVFLTAAFGVSKELTAVLVKEKPYLRYLLMDNRGHGKSMVGRTTAIEKNPMNLLAVGDHVREGDLANWHAENLTGLNEHVQYVHTKFMLIDPLGDNPTVVTGSANFSEPSTLKNDENMLVIQGDTRVADIYLTEFMRLFTHFRFRDLLHGTHRQGLWLRRVGRKIARTGSKKAPLALYLAPDDSWTKRFYVRGSADEKDRLHFACTTAKADWAR
jgi:phosphatidylserine/phosphatidylglycerophosphate/cardiolipin synthase-like enzyme